MKEEEDMTTALVGSDMFYKIMDFVVLCVMVVFTLAVGAFLGVCDLIEE